MIRRYLSNDYTRNLATLVSATVVAQVVNVAFNWVLARYFYHPDQFGALSVFTSLVSFITIISCAKFDVALVAAKTEEDASRLFSLGFLVLFIVTALGFVAYGLNLLPALHLYGGTAVFTWLWAAPVSAFLLTATQLMWMINVRDKKFRGISWVRIIETSANGFFSLVFFSLGTIGLLYGSLLSQLSSVLFLAWVVLKHNRLKSFFHPPAVLRDVARRFADFPRINILQGFFDIFQVSSVVIYIGKYFGEAAAGYYGQCMRILQIPMRLIILPVSHVFFAEASEIFRNNGDLFSLVKRTAYRTALFAAPVPLVLLAVGPWLFAFVFGAQWKEAGVYAQLLAPWIFFDLIRAPLVQVSSLLGKQRQVLLVTMAGNIILALLYVAGRHYSLSARWMLAGISVSQSIIAVILVFLIFRMSKVFSTR
ncbi:MAG TPA: oligosaccharide flippase family protein [Bacteroidia bacterium]|nr:oligosaccharide flippase family protein [Bacteroidia bacterium]